MPHKIWKHEFRTWIITFSYQIQQKNPCKTLKLPGNTDTPGILYTSLTKHRKKNNATNTTFQKPTLISFGVFWCRVFFNPQPSLKPGPTMVSPLIGTQNTSSLASPAVVSPRGNGENSNLFRRTVVEPTHLIGEMILVGEIFLGFETLSKGYSWWQVVVSQPICKI